MNRVADAIVIGSGALGASTAFYLAARGRAVVLVDKSGLASQSSARAAGLAQQVQVDDVLAALAIRGVRTLTSFQALTGQPLDVVVNGSVKVARLEGDAAQLEQEVRRGRALGVEIALVSAATARTVAPWLYADRAVAISHCPGDTYLEEPGTLPRAFLRALVERGGIALDHAGVTAILVEDRAVAGVITSKGRIEAPVVVDAAGAWARRVGDLVGCAIPLWPVRTQLCITEPLVEVDPRHATVRVMDAKAYVRPARGGLMFGAYEPDPLDLDPRERSRAMTSPCGKIRIPINESQDDKSQIEEYIREYHGEGIQHIALSTPDIYATVDALRANGVEFQDTPDTYYEGVGARVSGHRESLARMQERRILIDGSAEDGILLQIFTRNVIGPIFFEIIQRKGNEGFGEGNFRALFESIELDQERRGVI